MKELKYYISALYLSLFSRRFYADLIKNKSFTGIKYILILSLFMAIPLAFEVKYVMSQIFEDNGVNSDENIDYIAAQFPEITLDNDKLKTSLQTNQSIISKSGKLVAVFDVENKIDDLNGYEKVIVINDHSIRLKLPDEGGVIIIPANDFAENLKQYFENEAGNLSKLNKAKFFDDIKQLTKTTFLFTFIFSLCWFLFNYVISAFAYSFVAGIFVALMCRGNNFNFKQCFRIAAFTTTPVALLEIISNILSAGLFYNTSLVYFITHMLYIHFAVESYKKYRDKI